MLFVLIRFTQMLRSHLPDTGPLVLTVHKATLLHATTKNTNYLPECNYNKYKLLTWMCVCLCVCVCQITGTVVPGHGGVWHVSGGRAACWHPHPVRATWDPHPRFYQLVRPRMTPVEEDRLFWVMWKLTDSSIPCLETNIRTLCLLIGVFLFRGVVWKHQQPSYFSTWNATPSREWDACMYIVNSGKYCKGGLLGYRFYKFVDWNRGCRSRWLVVVGWLVGHEGRFMV